MQRSGRVGGGVGFICVMFALIAVLGVSLRAVPEWRGGALSNPDTFMRLIRLREMLDSGKIVYDVARDGSGHGTLLHWSHLIDSLLCLLALPFNLVLSPHAALNAAALIFGPLCIAALGFAVAWAASPFAERKWLWLGAILPPLSPAIVSYGIAGVVHHHVAIVIVAVACWGWAARLIAGHARAEAGVALGAWAGLGIWLTPETVPLTMMAFGALFLAWIVSPGRGGATALPRAIGLTGLSFALVTLLALLVDPPAAGPGSVEIDRLSILFAGLALAVAATAVGLWAAHRFVFGWRDRLVVASAIGAVFCSAWAVTFWEAIFRSDMVRGDSRLDAMFGHILEMGPVVGIFADLHFLLTGTLALLIATTVATRRRSVLATYAALCLAVLLFLGWSHVRFAAYPEAAGAIALPIALTLVGTATASWHQIGQSFTRLATIILFIQVPYLGQLPDVTSSARAAMVELPACKVSDAVGLLAPYPGAVVLADVNDTPEILYKTGVRTVGSLYHRNVDAFLRLRAAWRSVPSATVPPEIDAAEVSLVLGCKTPARTALVEDLRPNTLFDQVSTGHPPPWLRPIGENPASGHVLYEVVRPEDAAAMTQARR
jgi:hypothetical protein